MCFATGPGPDLNNQADVIYSNNESRQAKRKGAPFKSFFDLIPSWTWM